MSGNDFGWMTQRQGDRLSRQNEQILAQGRVLQRQQERTNEMLAEEAAKRAMAEQAVQEVFEISKRAHFIHQTKFRDPDLAALLASIEVCYLHEIKLTPQHCPTLDGKNTLTQAAELFTQLSMQRSAGGYQAIELIWALRLEKEFLARLGSKPYQSIEDGREEYWKTRDSRTTRWIIFGVLIFASVLIPVIMSSLSSESLCAAIVTLSILATISYIFYKIALQDVPFILNLQPIAERWLVTWQTFQSMSIRASIAQIMARYPELDTMLTNRLLCHPLPPKTPTDTTYVNGVYTPEGIVYQWRPGWYELRVGGFGTPQIQRVDLVRPQRIVFE